MKFKVIDNKTGKEADPYEIALHEEWAQGLVYCDMEGFMLTENGDLMLADECGTYVYCDPERFKVVFEDERPHGEWVHTTVGNTEFINCKKCGCGCPLYSYVKKGEKEEKVQHYETDFCPNCGADMREGEAE